MTLSDQEVDDAPQVGPLLKQIPGEIEQLTADGAYDGEPKYEAIAVHDAANAVVIPPRSNSTPPLGLGTNASHRDVHVHTLAALGRLGWQEVCGYGRRALVETAMGHYEALVGTRLHARSHAGRRTEAAVGAAMLNRMLAAGRPKSVPTVHGTT